MCMSVCACVCACVCARVHACVGGHPSTCPTGSHQGECQELHDSRRLVLSNESVPLSCV